ncbi:MAG: nucleotidyl transferase AbiEii/AbiGii toxin family protein [Bacteroidia bacterium]|nr:nucleotidyl transferase AbiEii/AbiGii toxin family protein [Bacteroidia bacterium]
MIEREFTLHKAQLYRLLILISDNHLLSGNISFKGGTCAKLLGYLDRLSVDLDFDLTGNTEKKVLRKELYGIFKKLGLKIKDESSHALQFFLKYEAPPQKRNTLKLEILDKKFIHNKYEPKYLADIDRIINCQTINTLFANKLVALVERYENTGNIAGRDVYDIHHFFMKGYGYNPELIEERRNTTISIYMEQLKHFIRNHITQRIIEQDINMLLSYSVFRRIRKTLKQETLFFLEEEIRRMI